MKALVLGATGFIGGHIAKAALDSGWEVSGLRREPGSIGHLAGCDIDWRSGNLNDIDSLKEAMQAVDVVFHAAAYYPKRKHRRTIAEHLQIAEEEIYTVLLACQKSGVQKLIYTSTLSTISHPPVEEDRLADERDMYVPGTIPDSAYYETKILMEKQVLAANSAEFQVVVLNPTAVFGPGDEHLALGSLLIAVAKGWLPFWLPGDINVVDVRDVAAAHVRAVESGEIGGRTILGGFNLSSKEAIDVVADVAGVARPRFGVPTRVLETIAFAGRLLPFLPLPINHLRTIREWQRYDTSKAVRDLGLNPRPFENTIREALDWFRQNGYL